MSEPIVIRPNLVNVVISTDEVSDAGDRYVSHHFVTAVETIARMVKAQADEGRPIKPNSAAFLAMYVLGELERDQ